MSNNNDGQALSRREVVGLFSATLEAHCAVRLVDLGLQEKDLTRYIANVSTADDVTVAVKRYVDEHGLRVIPDRGLGEVAPWNC